MLTSKQRAFLRKLSQNMDPIVHIGKEGVTENVIKQADDALAARELIKGTVQQNSSVSARKASQILCEATDAEGVSALGRKFVIYRRKPENSKINAD